MIPSSLVVVYEGKSPSFLKRLASFADTLPDVFNRLDNLQLHYSFTGLKRLRFVETLERGSGTLAHYDPNVDVISVYPLAFQIGGRIDLALYSGIGQRHWKFNVNNEDREKWTRKLVKADRAVIDRFSDAVTNTRFGRYEELLKNFHSSVDRLQAIHLINALKKNSISPTQAKNLSIYNYPPTKDFCSGSRPFSITPLMSVYSGGMNLISYDQAFAHFCSRNGKFGVAEDSVEAALLELFKSITFRQ